MCIINFIEQQLLGVRARLTGRITAIVKENGGHIDSHFMDDETVTIFPPIVVSKDSNGYNRYGGYEAAHLISVFLRRDDLFCILNGEAGENFEQPITSIQIEGLLEILKWFKESGIPVVDEEEILVCNECGSTDVQEQAWVDANAKSYIGFNGDDRDDRWCEECDGHNLLCNMKKFKEKMQRWWDYTDFKEMERLTGLRQTDFSTEDGSQDFVDACNAWWKNKSYNEQRIIFKESNE